MRDIGSMKISRHTLRMIPENRLQPRRKCHCRRLALETLEQRTLLSATGDAHGLLIQSPAPIPRAPLTVSDPQPVTLVGNFGGSVGTPSLSDLVVDATGTVFGETDGGSNPDGTVFEILPGSGNVTPFALFDGSNGQSPHGGLIVDSAGNLYGSTTDGGENGRGTIFMIQHGTATITTLADFMQQPETVLLGPWLWIERETSSASPR